MAKNGIIAHSFFQQAISITVKTIDSLNQHHDAPALALTIGNFDGVHIGHQAIFNTLKTLADSAGLVPAAMTFSPHAKLFFQQHRNFLITSDSEKAELLAQNGIERLFQIPFDADFAAMPAPAFVDALIHHLNVKYILIGDDFRFGSKGLGDFSLLQRLCPQHGVKLSRTDTLAYQGSRVSSSRVRRTIAACDFELTRALLGRTLSYRGQVISGRQLGRTIDFPTANVRLPDERLLPDGVFAVNVRVGERTYQGMSNIGTKPTVDSSHQRQIETHLFDFSGNLYGETLQIAPIVKLRDEQTFASVEALTAQLHLDKANALVALQKHEYECTTQKQVYTKPKK